VNGLRNIWRYSLKDRSLTQITFGTGPDYSPMPDPGGKGVYFVNGKSSGFMTVYHVNSKESKDIVSEDTTGPVISPDGRHVMYIALAGPERSELWASDIDGGNKMRIASGEELGTGTWAPDSFHLGFFELGTNIEHQQAFIAAADGNGLRQVPPVRGAPYVPVWSPDQKSVYLSVNETGTPTFSIWKWNINASNPEKLVDQCGIVFDSDLSGQYLLAVELGGEKTGIYAVSISEKKCVPLLPGVVTFTATFAPDGKSFLYAVAHRGEVTIFRQPWSNGKVIGTPQVALKVPFAFPLTYQRGNAYAFSRNLSTIVYAPEHTET